MMMWLIDRKDWHTDFKDMPTSEDNDRRLRRPMRRFLDLGPATGLFSHAVAALDWQKDQGGERAGQELTRPSWKKLVLDKVSEASSSATWARD